MKSVFSLLAIFAEVLVLIGSALASPPHVVRDVDVRRTQPAIRNVRQFSKRNATTTLGTVSLATQLSDEVLFSIDLSGVVSIPGSPNLTVTCLSCFTTGSASLLTSGFSQDQALLANIPVAAEELIKDPLGFVQEALDVTFEIDFQDLAGHFEFDVSFASSGSFTFPLFHPITPLGASIDGNQIGFVFTIDLIFSVDGQLDATTGFDISWPNTTTITVDPLKGQIMEMDLTAIKLQPLPVTVRSGTACIEVALRFGLRAGLGINLIGTGLTVEAGAFIDAPAYKACAHFNSTAACELSLTEEIFGDAGAYADIAVSIDFINIQQGPSVVTTFFVVTLPATCLASSTVLATTASKAMITAAPVYSNATTTAAHVTASSTKPAVVSGSTTVLTITKCASALLWCPPSLQTAITITKTLNSSPTANTSMPSITITNAVTIVSLATPAVSTVQATTQNMTISKTVSAGNFAQQLATRNATTITPRATASALVSGNGTALQFTGGASRLRSNVMDACTALVGLMGLFMWLA